MEVSEEVLRRMASGKVFKDNESRINGVDFSNDGALVVTSSDDKSVNLYDAMSAQRTKTVFSSTYGVDLVRFTHHPSAIICASRHDYDHSLRYWSLHDNRFIRFFKGHKAQALSLSMCPRDDTFMSSSKDGTARLWDLRVNQCRGVLEVRRPSVVSYDPQGLLFAVAFAPNRVNLYDSRKYESGPFEVLRVQEHSTFDVRAMKFSNDGKYILLSMGNGQLFCIDAYEGKTVRQFSVPNDGGVTLEPTFTPDSQFVMCGSENGYITVWSIASGSVVAQYAGHAGVPSIVQWSPSHMMFASACTNLVFWIPRPQR
eukprot:GILK01006992.1.p1 GENE.GILK01006992.1~~GILK01006992.1.p1  ORF type:complete len:313 (-),score=33.83 GILK01006992.1:106-1044(-)